MTFFTKNTSKDSFSTTDYYTFEGHHHPLLINYPIYESTAHFRPTFDHHLQVLSILKELDTPTSVNPEPPLYTVTYHPNKQISQQAIPLPYETILISMH